MEPNEKYLAVGGVLGAIAASSCCVLPLVLVSLGATGTWIGGLSVMAPYKPFVVAGTVALLSYGYYLVYRPQRTCAPDEVCARPLPSRFVKLALWAATVLVVVAASFDYLAPLLLGA